MLTKLYGTIKRANAYSIDQIKAYLDEKITRSWYLNAKIDYGITGRFIDAYIDGNSLAIIWEEENERHEYLVRWYGEYTLEEIYIIWMEMGK